MKREKLKACGNNATFFKKLVKIKCFLPQKNDQKVLDRSGNKRNPAPPLTGTTLDYSEYTFTKFSTEQSQ